MTVPLEVTLDVKDVDGVLFKLESLFSEASISEFFLGFVEPSLQKRIQARFEGEGDDAVGKWNALSEATVEIRQNLGYGGAHPINKRTGELQEFVTGAKSQINSIGEGLELVYPGSLPTGELGRKFEVAQQGETTLSGSNIPARPVLGLSSYDMITITTELAFRVNEGLLR